MPPWFMAAMGSEGDGVVYAIAVAGSCIGRDLQPLTEECRSHFTRTPSGSFSLILSPYGPPTDDCIVSPSAVFCALVYQQFLIVTLRSWLSKMQSSDGGHET